ncbi:MAG TPA: hypothetical protein VMS93_05105 [Candidatus Saccharimonadales bacterium]|nr:hypothetical protein [Candidatus Saccharimonadales bacterium]
MRSALPLRGLASALAPLALAALAAGCGSSSNGTTTPTGKSACISGIVRLNSVPVRGALVASATGALATTDTTGYYMLTVAANATIALGVSYTTGGVNYVGAAVVNSGAASTSCLNQDFALTPSTGGGGGGGGSTRYTINAYLFRSGSTDSGTAVVTIHDDSLNAAVTAALVTLTPAGGQAVTLQYSYGTYTATGYHGLPFPYLPMTYGTTYTLRADINADGQRIATAVQKLPGLITITAPAANATVGTSFDVTWSIQPATDSTAYFAVLAPSAPNPLQGFVNSGTTAHFTGVSTGACIATLNAWRGPWWGGPAPGVNVQPNISGGGATGYFWAYNMSDPVAFNVASAAPSRWARR